MDYLTTLAGYIHWRLTGEKVMDVGEASMALLAAYMLWKDGGETLEDYLEHKVFANAKASTLMADEGDIAGFNTFLARYKAALPVEKLAAEVL